MKAYILFAALLLSINAVASNICSEALLSAQKPRMSQKTLDLLSQPDENGYFARVMIMSAFVNPISYKFTPSDFADYGVPHIEVARALTNDNGNLALHKAHLFLDLGTAQNIYGIRAFKYKETIEIPNPELNLPLRDGFRATVKGESGPYELTYEDGVLTKKFTQEYANVSFKDVKVLKIRMSSDMTIISSLEFSVTRKTPGESSEKVISFISSMGSFNPSNVMYKTLGDKGAKPFSGYSPISDFVQLP